METYVLSFVSKPFLYLLQAFEVFVPAPIGLDSQALGYFLQLQRDGFIRSQVAQLMARFCAEGGYRTVGFGSGAASKK